MKAKIGFEHVQWEIPKTLILTAGSSSGKSELTAFDNALLDAGIGNLNLLKVTSVLPPGAKVFLLEECKFALPKGAMIPTVYTRIINETDGILISSAIGVGIPDNNKNNGMIFEASITGSKEKAEISVCRMIEEAFESRGYILKDSIVVSSEIEISKNISCTLAAALLL
jgi:arginine decarboxylase